MYVYVYINLFFLTTHIEYRLQKFADECMVPHLRASFNELADLITAALSRELVALVSADSTTAGREKRIKMFPCLNTNMLADLLEKVS